jgi:hypothetical protein
VSENSLPLSIVRPTHSDNPRGSPGAKERKLEQDVEKYVIGETYSGEKERKVKAKVNELELKISKMKVRHEGNHSGRSCPDISSLVGAAMLAILNGSKPRASAATFFKRII